VSTPTLIIPRLGLAISAKTQMLNKAVKNRCDDVMLFTDLLFPYWLTAYAASGKTLRLTRIL
jgi:hypothetical protein